MTPLALVAILLAALAYRIATKTRHLRVLTATEIREVAGNSRLDGLRPAPWWSRVDFDIAWALAHRWERIR